MKNIQFIFIVLLQLAIIPMVAGQQTTLNNGRSANATPAPAVQQDANDGVQYRDVFDGDDLDDPRSMPERSDENMYFPQDIEVLQDELFNSSSPQEVIEQVQSLKRLVTELNRTTEELRRENRLIRRSLGACCSRDELGFTANDAYLLQNAPNPSTDRTVIEYFIPEGLRQAQIEVRDVKGVLLQTFDAEAKGMSQLTLNAGQFASGTYLYYLTIGGEVVDSKVMIVNQ
jgi:hypothetical protein